MESKYLYRYKEHRNVYSDEYDNYLLGSMKVKLEEYLIIKETKCGCWIFTGYYFGNKDNTDIPKEYQKFVNLTCRKKFACRTKEDAKESFIARKNRQIKILKSQLKDAEEAIIVLTNILKSQLKDAEEAIIVLTNME